MSFLLLGQVTVGTVVDDRLLAGRARPGEWLAAHAGAPAKLLGVVVGLDNDGFFVGGRSPVQVERFADLIPAASRLPGLADVAELRGCAARSNSFAVSRHAIGSGSTPLTPGHVNVRVRTGSTVWPPNPSTMSRTASAALALATARSCFACSGPPD